MRRHIIPYFALELGDSEALTVFLPTDEAFQSLGLGVASSLQLPANRQRLTQLLKYHTVRGRWPRR